jgi:hypothetical protein
MDKYEWEVSDDVELEKDWKVEYEKLKKDHYELFKKFTGLTTQDYRTCECPRLTRRVDVMEKAYQYHLNTVKNRCKSYLKTIHRLEEQIENSKVDHHYYEHMDGMFALRPDQPKDKSKYITMSPVGFNGRYKRIPNKDT